MKENFTIGKSCLAKTLGILNIEDGIGAAILLPAGDRLETKDIMDAKNTIDILSKQAIFESQQLDYCRQTGNTRFAERADGRMRAFNFSAALVAVDNNIAEWIGADLT